MIRVGHGYDVHRLVKGRDLILCGIKIDSEKGLLGHSDADVAIHAIIDSILGAAALGDIGYYFRDDDLKYKDIDSKILLSMAFSKINAMGFRIENIDCTIIAQKPKLNKYIYEMRNLLSNELSIDISQINVKATTEEGLGFTGREQGIAAHAVSLLIK